MHWELRSDLAFFFDVKRPHKCVSKQIVSFELIFVFDRWCHLEGQVHQVVPETVFKQELFQKFEILLGQ